MQQVWWRLTPAALTAAALGLCGCSSTMIATSLGTTVTGDTAPVSISITDDPPAGVSVLFFQVDLTAAALQSSSGSSVSLLSGNTPVQIDVTRLQALSAFLSAADVPQGRYSSLSLTFANPQMVIMNTSDASLGSSCAVGSVCQLTPAFDNSATITLSSAPFPVTVQAGSPLGFLVDFHLNTIIQSDLSVNLAAANAVSVNQLPPAGPSGPPQFGAVMGAVTAVDAAQSQFTLQTPDGRSFTVATSAATAYSDFPGSACSSPGFDCVAQGQMVNVQVTGVEPAHVLEAGQVTYMQAQGQQTVVGTIVEILPLPTPAGETIVNVLLHASPTAATGLPVGGLATVALWDASSGHTPATTFSIDSNGFTIPSGYTFASTNDLALGQTLLLTVAPGTLVPPTATGAQNPWSPPVTLSFAASGAALEPSQITGTVSDISSPNFVLSYLFEPVPVLPLGQLLQFNVETTAQTAYQGFAPDSFSGIQNNDAVSVSGWLFPPSGPASTANVVAQQVVLQPNAVF